MPLYTLWNEGTTQQIVLYGLHCTGGDILIGLSSLTVSLLVFGTSDWPTERYLSVAGWAIGSGLTVTIISEWYNIHVAGSWSYSSLMPQIFGIGLSPIAQWLVIPGFAFWWVKKQIDKNLSRV